jgi:hypothetical protein
MTRGQRDYSNAKIYEIVCNITGDRYIGATCKKYISSRLSAHEHGYKEWKKGNGSFTNSYIIIERGDYNIVLIENFPCSSINELNQREQYWIKQKLCVNKQLPRTTEEREQYNQTYYQEHATKLKQVSRDYYHNNKELCQKKNKEYYETHKNEIAIQVKQYRETKKEQLKEYFRAYHERNKEKRNQQSRLNYEKRMLK